MRENVFAYTAPGGDMPAFISVNREDTGAYSVHVRSPKETGGQAQIALTKEQIKELVWELAKKVARDK